MTQLYWSPCIAIGAARYYLPPLMTIDDSLGQTVRVVNPPYADRAYIVETYANHPCQVSLKIASPALTANKAREVLDWIENVRAQLMGRTFSLYLFNDRGYEVCALSGSTHRVPSGPLTWLDAGLDIISETGPSAALPTLEFPGGYENDYPYADLVGIPKGTTSGGGGIVIQSPRQVMDGIFSGGQYVATDPGNEHVFTVGGSPGSVWTLESLQITSAGNFDAAGQTDVVISTTPMGVAGPEILATVAANKTSSVRASGSLPVTAGSDVYVYLDDGGGHTDVQYSFQLRG